ncbi:Arc family DNA-binding protein [Nocardia otitidiscaviarum]|uniref:Arc family DNA-binding protein n=1 Tax=Nocardia otitidiscaviarum TaxID=1823 RepID=A0A516NT10_9NOCA|nr:Arc family DNA-binding protein [Nocardia otitidiscaviarum]MCP9621318.1 Arc family DNA-binding protein [Nocardia otitidiscaviarum]QDP82037.1 Arc family DNA-binding protein [Nocardia otitidiscaviarum]
MKNVTIRNLSDEVHRAIRQRAATHGRSVEAEMRAILAEAVQPPERIKLGSLLAGGISEENKLTDEEHEIYFGRDRTPAEPMEFE